MMIRDLEIMDGGVIESAAVQGSGGQTGGQRACSVFGRIAGRAAVSDRGKTHTEGVRGRIWMLVVPVNSCL